MSKIGNWIAHAYYYFLWCMGFKDSDGSMETDEDREKITFMLRRMKERLGMWWWGMSLGTLFGVWTLMIRVSWWWLPAVAFVVWLFVHVLEPGRGKLLRKR